MSAITLQPRIASRIKPPPSQRRHLWQAGALIVVAALVAMIAARYFRHEDVSHLRELAQFSSRYATECDVPEFNAPLSPLVRNAYRPERHGESALAHEVSPRRPQAGDASRVRGS